MNATNQRSQALKKEFSTPEISAAESARVERHRLPRSLSVVIPCYNEEAVIHALLERLSRVLSSINIPFEIVLVDDGSKDHTWAMMRECQQDYQPLKIVRLSRNYGHQIALTCGLDQAVGEVVIIMDADLQDPPEILPEMIAQWSKGYDVVYGKRRERQGESSSKKFFAFMFYRIFSRVAGFSVPEDTGDFRLMDRRAVNALQSMRERQRFIRGMVSWIGYHQVPVYYDRAARAAGETKYPIRKSLVLAFDAFTSFSFVPLRIASYLGFALSLFSLGYIVVVLVLNVLGRNLPGYTSLMGAILLLGGVQLLVLGILGEYVGRIYEQGKLRPLYLIDQIAGEPLQKIS